MCSSRDLLTDRLVSCPSLLQGFYSSCKCCVHVLHAEISCSAVKWQLCFASLATDFSVQVCKWLCWSAATVVVCAIHEDAVQPSITPTGCSTCFQPAQTECPGEFGECLLGSFLPVTEQVPHNKHVYIVSQKMYTHFNTEKVPST